MEGRVGVWEGKGRGRENEGIGRGGEERGGNLVYMYMYIGWGASQEIKLDRNHLLSPL